MAEYQLVPYTFKVHLRGQPQDLRSLADVAGTGLSALDLTAGSAFAHAGSPRLLNELATTSMEIERVCRGPRATMMQAAHGQSGVRARVLQRRGADLTRHEVLERDWTQTPLRNVLVVPPGVRVGLLLVERVGNTGVLTRLHQMIDASLQQHFPDLRVDIAPAMSPAAMKAWAEDAAVHSIVIQHTHSRLGQSARHVKGLPVGQVMEFKAPRRHSWRIGQFGGIDGATQASILTELVPQLPGVTSLSSADEIAAQMLDEGWTVALQVKKGGRRRKLQVETKAGITMTYPASVEGKVGQRSEHDDFITACQGAMQEMADDGMDFGDPKNCAWTDTACEDELEWKAVWGVSESESAESPR